MATSIDPNKQTDNVITQTLEEELQGTSQRERLKHQAEKGGAKPSGNDQQAAAVTAGQTDSFDNGAKPANGKYTGRDVAGTSEGKEAEHHKGHHADSQSNFDAAETFKVGDVIKNQAIQNRTIKG